MSFEVHPDPKALAARGAALFFDSLHAAVAARGRFFVALAGGNTPREMYEAIGRRSGEARSGWSATRFFWGDERCVPASDERSNERMARASLLAHVPVDPTHVFPMRCTGDAEEAARRYEELLRTQLGAPLRFDLVFLGLGEDAHTASLFPGSALLDERERLVGIARRPQEAFARMTLTLPVINRAARVVFLVSGAAKAEALRRAINLDRAAPASFVCPRAGEICWLVDAAAASHLGGACP